MGKRSQLGLGWGDQLSLSIRTRILDEDGWIPDVAMGARDVMGSLEAFLFSVSDPDTASLLQGEFYLVGSKTLFSRIRIHIGTSFLSGIEDGYPQPFGGVEQYLGLGFSLTWEIFNRFGAFHQNLGFDWKFRKLFRLTFGLTELQSWVVQNGKWGLFTKPIDQTGNGYDSPGIFFSARVSGWSGRERQTLEERMKKVETRLLTVQKDMSQAMGNLQRLSETIEKMGIPG